MLIAPITSQAPLAGGRTLEQPPPMRQTANLSLVSILRRSAAAGRVPGVFEAEQVRRLTRDLYAAQEVRLDPSAMEGLARILALPLPEFLRLAAHAPVPWPSMLVEAPAVICEGLNSRSGALLIRSGENLMAAESIAFILDDRSGQIEMDPVASHVGRLRQPTPLDTVINGLDPLSVAGLLQEFAGDERARHRELLRAQGWNVLMVAAPWIARVSRMPLRALETLLVDARRLNELVSIGPNRYLSPRVKIVGSHPQHSIAMDFGVTTLAVLILMSGEGVIGAREVYPGGPKRLPRGQPRMLCVQRRSMRVRDQVTVRIDLARIGIPRVSNPQPSALPAAPRRRHGVRGHWMRVGRPQGNACVTHVWEVVTSSVTSNQRRCVHCGQENTFRRSHERGALAPLKQVYRLS